MKNKKIIAGLLLATVAVTGISVSFANDSTNSGITNTIRGFNRMNNLTAEQKTEMEAIKVIMDKKTAGTTLTAEEQTKLDNFEANRPIGKGIGIGRGFNGEKGLMGGEMGERGFMGASLTDAEKTALESMTDAEKQTFFETKMTEQKTKMEAHENVIDKVLAGSTLTSEEETTKQEIIKERAEKKLERETREAEMVTIKPILEKKKAGTTLTSDEQAKLDVFQSEGHGKGMKGMRR